MQLSNCPELAINQKTGNEFLTNSFLLSSLVTGPSFMSRSPLVLELWQLYLITDWPGIWKLKIPRLAFAQYLKNYQKLGIPNLARMSLTTCFLIASKSQGYSFYRFWVIKRKPTGDGQGVGANYTIPRFLLKSNYITINTLHPRNLWLKSNDLTIITLTPYNIK